MVGPRDRSTVLGLDLQALAALVEVIDSGSFTAAAASLGVSQPAVSLAVKRLEERLGTTLLLRPRSGVTPSRAGELLARGAVLALDTLADAVHRIGDELDEPQGKVRLGCHESLAAYVLPGFMARFLRAYPRVELALWNGRSLQVEQALLEGQIDLGLVVNPSHHPDTVVQHLFDDSVELLCASAAAGRRRAADLVASMPLLHVPELPQSQYILAALGERGLRTRPLPCSSLELVKSLVLDQVGVGILPRRVVEHGAGRRRLRSLSPAMPHYPDRVALVRRFDLPRTAAVKVVVERMLEHGRTLDRKLPAAPARPRRRSPLKIDHP